MTSMDGRARLGTGCAHNASEISARGNWCLGLVFLLPVLLGLLLAGPAAAEALVPEREVVQQDSARPAWKTRWAEARDLVRRQLYREAGALYEELLAEQGHLEEARWELARLWLQLGEAERAMLHFELLQEAEPTRPEYGRGLAAALLAAGHFGRAAELFHLLLGQDPDEPELLAGLSEALLAKEQGAEALPYLEKLVGLDPEQPIFSEKLARLYQQQGMPGKARPLARRLAEPAAAADRILVLAAEVHESLGLSRQAAGYWRRLLERDPTHPRAAARLESYQLAEGQGEEALRYLLPALAAAPEDTWLLRRLAEVYLGLNRMAEALPYLERYLELRPADREVLTLALETYNALDQRAEALLTLERMLALDGEAAPDKLVQAALLYEEQGRYAKALELYPRILSYYPADPVLSARKLRLLSVMQREAEIGDFLNRPERRDQVPAILAAWHQLEPDNRQVMVALSFAYLEEGELGASERLLDRLARTDGDDPEMLRARAALRAAQSRPYAALKDYEQLLRQDPRQREPRRRGLLLAAELGLPLEVREHSAPLEAAAAGDRSLAMELGAVRRDALDLGPAAAGFAALLAQAETPEEQIVVLLQYAEVFLRAGLPYEAEELLRIALLRDQNQPAIYHALFNLALEQALLAEAEVWLAGFTRALRHYPSQEAVSPDRPLSVVRGRILAEEMQLRLWSAGGDHRGALSLLRRLLQEEEGRVDDFRLLAVKVLLAADSLRSAENMVRDLLGRPYPDPEALVLAALISDRQGREREAADLLEGALVWAEIDPGRQLKLAAALNSHQFRPKTAAELAGQALAAMPGSARAALLQAEALAADGQTGPALALLEQLPPALGELFSIEQRRVELLLHLGRVDEVVELTEKLAAAYPWSASSQRLVRVHALWLQRQWRPAIGQLEEGLIPPVLELMVAGAEAEAVALPPDDPPGIWGRVTGAVNPLVELVDEVMSPAYAAGLQPGEARLRQISAPLYASYRWQQRFTFELRARGAVERREFFAAAREFERLAQQYPDEGPILYDLAGLYSRMERLEAEAAIYRRLQADNLRYPGLEEARLRNDLKRRPRSTLHYGYRREEGRDGYKAMAQEWLAASQRLAPYVGHEFDLSVSRRHYRDTDGPGSLRARQVELLYRRDAFAGVDLVLGLGGFLPEGEADEGRDTLLGRAEIAGDFGDRFWGRVAYRRAMVEDTLAAVNRGIWLESLAAEAALDLLPRLEAGSGYNFHYYSDGNQTHGYDLWLVYTVLTDPTLLTVSYTYDFRDSQAGPQRGGELLADGFSADDHPYWAPLNHWRKTFAVAFRHQLSDDPFLRDAPRYYSLRYATSYDSDGYGHQTLAGGFFLEWTPKLIFQAGIELVSGSDYRSREISTALTYRW
jgi:tetratricopeptide (TPR) repeat protein